MWMPENLSQEFLLTCLGCDCADQARQVSCQLSKQDWQGAIHLAKLLDVTPCFFQRLRELGLENLPGETLHQQLQSAYLRSAHRNILLFKELGLLLAEFSKKEIVVIPLKGAYLAEAVYNNLAVRPMHDLDLLVGETDLARAANLLAGMSYSPEREYQIQEELLKSNHLPPYRRPGGCPVELHWSILHPDDPFKMDMPGLWSRSQESQIAGSAGRVLNPADLLLHLIFHFSFQHHFFTGLLPLVDITCAIQHFQDELDWDLLLELAKSGGLERCAGLTLQAALDLLSARIPEKVIASLSISSLKQDYLQTIEKFIMNGSTQLTTNLSELFEPLDFKTKAGRFLKRLFVPPSVLARQFNIKQDSPVIYFYYLVRLRYLLANNLHPAINLLFGRPSTRQSAILQNEVMTIQDWMGYRQSKGKVAV